MPVRRASSTPRLHVIITAPTKGRQFNYLPSSETVLVMLPTSRWLFRFAAPQKVIGEGDLPDCSVNARSQRHVPD
jgi:hypothetical protein